MCVHPVSELKKWEETYQFQQQEEIKKETERLKADKERLIKEMRNKAVKDLIFRLRFNGAFAKGGRYSLLTAEIANQLEELIKKAKV